MSRLVGKLMAVTGIWAGGRGGSCGMVQTVRFACMRILERPACGRGLPSLDRYLIAHRPARRGSLSTVPVVVVGFRRFGFNSGKRKSVGFRAVESWGYYGFVSSTVCGMAR